MTVYSQNSHGTPDKRRGDIIEILRRNLGPVSTSQLALRLDTSAKTIERDLSRLRSSGFNINSTTGRLGGITLAESADDGAANSPSKRPSLEFVGRLQERAELESVLESLNSGKGAIATIRGEPGTGKTRLVQEFTRICTARGFRVWKGQSLEGIRTPSLWPWTELLRNAIDDTHQLANWAHVAESATEIVREFSPTDPDHPEPETERQFGDPENKQFRQFDKFSTFLRNLPKPGAVLVLEDIHWADSVSIELFEFLAHSLVESRVAVVATYDPQRVPRRSRVRRLIGALARSDMHTRISLPPLNRAEVGQLLNARLKEVLPEGTVDRIFSSTNGNPFLVSETARHLQLHPVELDSGPGKGPPDHWPMPESIRDAIDSKLDRLSEPCVRVLSAASAIGHNFSSGELEVLADSGDLDRSPGAPESIPDLLDQAVRSGIIEPGNGLREYRFAHGFMRQALAEEISTTQQIRLDAAIGLSLEKSYGAESWRHARQLAHHFISAESITGTGVAARYALLAGEQCLGSYAFEEAEQWFQGVLNLRPDRLDDESKYRARYGLGRALAFSLPRSRKHEAVSLLVEAVSHYVSTEQPDTAIEVASTPLVPISGDGQRGTDVAGMIELVIDLTPRDRRISGYLQVQFSNAMLIERGDTGAAEVAARTAKDIAIEISDDRLALMADQALLSLDFSSGIGVDITGKGRRLIGRAIELQEVQAELRGRFYLGTYLLISGLLDDSLVAAEQFLERAEKYADNTSIEQALGQIASIHVRRGEWHLALEVAEANTARFGQSAWSAIPVRAVETYTGSPGRSAATTAPARTMIPQNKRADIETGLLALALRAYSRDDSRIRDIRDIVENSDRSGGARSQGMTRPAIGALLAVLYSQQESARQYQKSCASFSGRSVSPTGVSGSRILGILAEFTGDPATAHRHFTDAVLMTRKNGALPELAGALIDLAQVIIDNPDLGKHGTVDTSGAGALIAEATKIAESLGMAPLTSRISDLVDTTALPDAANPQGLSQRELEVLALIAAGKTTREIAHSLTVAESTVTRHTTNILEKIGARNRAEATGYAYRLGLVMP